MNGPDSASQKYFTASLRDIDREGASHLPVVDDAGRRYPERRKAVRVRLARRDSLSPDELEPVSADDAEDKCTDVRKMSDVKETWDRFPTSIPAKTSDPATHCR